jgi:uncharacterized membrane protein YqjE
VSQSAPSPETGQSGSAGSAQTDDRSVVDIIGDVAGDLTALVRQELELATAELKQEATKAGKGAGMLGGAGLVGHLALVFFSLALVYLLDNWLPAEVAALIVTALWAVVAALLAVRGKKQLQSTHPQLPTTQRTLKEDVQWARAQKS